jgi:hypothetical protein
MGRMVSVEMAMRKCGAAAMPQREAFEFDFKSLFRNGTEMICQPFRLNGLEVWPRISRGQPPLRAGRINSADVAIHSGGGICISDGYIDACQVDDGETIRHPYTLVPRPRGKHERQTAWRNYPWRGRRLNKRKLQNALLAI